MENMDKGLTVPKCVLINQPKKYQKCSQIYLPKLHAQVWDFDEKKLHWASVDRGQNHIKGTKCKEKVFSVCLQKVEVSYIQH